MARLATGVILCLAMALVLTGAAVATPTAEASDSPDPAEPAVWITIEIDSSGDAQWSIAYRFDTGTEEQAAAFDALVDDVEAGAVELPLDGDALAAFLADADAVTDREMELVDVGWQSDRTAEVGTLTLEATWQNFAAVDDNQLSVGSAFDGTHGTWLGTFDEGMRLTIVGPDGEAPHTVPDAATLGDDGSVTWDGPHTFSAGELDLRYPIEGATGTSAPAAWIAVVGLILALGAGVALLAYRRDWRPQLGTDKAADDIEDEPVDVELLSDPERVERLLRVNGGRMKQKAIIEETGWSSAKVSQLLSEMADEGRIEKLRIGQENLIALPSPDDEVVAES